MAEPATTPPSTVTSLLLAWSEGDAEARDRLLPLVYADLRRLAARRLRAERAGHTLQPTALVHEAFVRLVGAGAPALKDRAHFFRLAAQVMRRILVDHARKRRALKRDRGPWQIDISRGEPADDRDEVELLALDRALQELGSFDLRKSQIVEARFFGGLSIEEAAAALEVSPATVKREWTVARAWLYDRLKTGDAGRGRDHR